MSDVLLVATLLSLRTHDDDDIQLQYDTRHPLVIEKVTCIMIVAYTIKSLVTALLMVGSGWNDNYDVKLHGLSYGVINEIVIFVKREDEQSTVYSPFDKDDDRGQIDK
ncbi:uncharacterized protein BX664DRAFT_386105 [Halteromyces radiatus]|uniref:uncharacterized protein n=1 Tax=Halteromyces radiatus TaxID=101107 RepID=UPI00221FD30A|nr:uncharacterized protein BX664DRAFT_386105 [Halteromyces radiatus]KAI8089647.1 hypothetical protein BX664DRAFT_386105 [Halteromyces radiatus]